VARVDIFGGIIAGVVVERERGTGLVGVQVEEMEALDADKIMGG
jgi:hypothetical protein